MTPEDHSGGPILCEQLGPFVDGELGAMEAAAFRGHLVQCARCQQEMHGLMQLSALAEQARKEAPGRKSEAAPVWIAAADRRARPRRAAWLGVVGAVAMAAALVLAIRGRPSGPDVPTLLASLDARTVSGWPSVAGAAQYKEYRVMRGGPVPIPPGLAQAELRLQGSSDWRSLGTLALLRRDFAQADAYLARLPPTPDVLADRGLVRLEEQRYSEALEFLDAALSVSPEFLPARFNRALALQALQLPFAAAAAMGPVAQSAPGGWATEARRDSSSFEAAKKELQEDEARWKEARRALIERQVGPPPALVSSHRSLARSAYYHAVASAPSRVELERLRAFARELDREAGSSVLESDLDLVVRGWTPARPELAARYRAWITVINPTLPAAEDVEKLVADARRAGQKDILLQVLDGFRAYVVTPEREALVRTFHDPWFEASLASRVGRVQMDGGRLGEAERTLRQGRELCRPQSMQIPCWYIAEALGDLYRVVGRFSDAEREYRTVAPQLRAAGLFPWERKAVMEAARVAVQADQLALARASYEDLSIREPDKCAAWIWSRELLASGYVARRDVANARKVLAVHQDCPRALDPEAWRARWRLGLGQLTRDRSMLEEARAMAAATAGFARAPVQDVAAARMLEHIATLELGTPGAEAELARTIAREEASPDVQVRSAAAEGREALALRALDRKDGAAALAELGHLLGTTAPSRCAVGLIANVAREGWAVADAAGAVVTGSGDPRPGEVFTPPAELIARLRPCANVAVLATGRFQGRRGVLPDDLPWSYQIGPGSSGASRPGPNRLVVKDVVPPRDLQLPALALQDRSGESGWTVVAGAEATPARVLSELAGADLVKFEVHGLIDSSVPDGAVLVLSEDADHGYSVSATQLGSLHLARRPIVMLGACRAAAPSTFRAEPWSLPRSFVHAGAQGVYASLSDLPDQEVGEFFRRLTARLDAGTSPASALRDERLTWLREGKTWVRDVVLFD